MVAQSCTTQNWTHTDAVIAVHSRSTGELARAFSCPWKALELWQEAKENRQYDSYWCASCGSQRGYTAEHVEGEFFRKIIFVDLANYRRSRPSRKVYKLKEMNDCVSLILTFMLSLCYGTAPPLGSTDICGCLPFLTCRVRLRTCRWRVAMMGGEYAKWDVWRRRGVWHDLPCLWTSRSRLSDHLISCTFFSFIFFIIILLAYLMYKLGSFKYHNQWRFDGVSAQWIYSLSTSRWAWCLYYSLA